MSITLSCPPNSKNCVAQLAAKVMEGGPNNYPVTLLNLSTDVQAVPDGFRVNMRITIANREAENFGSFKLAISPGWVLQGAPLGPPPVFMLAVDSLAAGATGVFHVDGVILPGPSGGRFKCMDETFVPATTT